MIVEQINKILKTILIESNLPIVSIHIEHPTQEDYGDYSTNIAMQLFKKLNRDFKSPIKLAEHLVKKIKKHLIINPFKPISNVTIAGSGFINFHVSKDYLISEMLDIVKKKKNYGSSKIGKNKTYVIEHTSPNPNKSMHLGHLRNNITGMSIANICEFLGYKVIRDNVDNNRGIAIAKLMWGYLKFAHRDNKKIENISYWYDHQDEWLTPDEAGQKPDRFMDKLYVTASDDFKIPEVKKIVRQMVVNWEAGEPKNHALWKLVLSYAYKGQELTLRRLGNKWDKIWHEHEHYKKGKELVEEGIKKGVFKKLADGAIITNLEKDYHLTDTVVIKKDGTALYITQDLALTQLKKKTFNPDKIFWVIGPEQSLALKQMFAVCEQLGIIDYKDCVHIPYGYISLKNIGKMSSREGNVVYIDDLLDDAQDRILKIIKSDTNIDINKVQDLAEDIGIGAVKYSILKTSRMKNTSFDPKESISFEGNSGPYLQYTHARAQSVLLKAGNAINNTSTFSDYNLNHEELSILRWLYRFPEIILDAGKNYSPHLLCTYLYELSQRYNVFYNKHSILNISTKKTKTSKAKLSTNGLESKTIAFRVHLTYATAKVIRNGLKLLGISAPNKM